MQATSTSLGMHSRTSKSSAAASPSAAGQLTLNSIEILQGQKSITIEHNGALYRLQATKLGKLILTK